MSLPYLFLSSSHLTSAYLTSSSCVWGSVAAWLSQPHSIYPYLTPFPPTN